MLANLVAVVDEAGQPVRLVDLPGELAGGVPNQVFVQRLRLVRIEGVRLVAIDAEAARAAEEPQLVGDQPAADTGVEVVEGLGCARCHQPARGLFGGDVAALQRAAGVGAEQLAAQRVAAVLADQVHADAAGADFSRQGPRLHHDLFVGALIRVLAGHAAVPGIRGHVQAVGVPGQVATLRTVNRDVRGLPGLGSADVRTRGGGARHQHHRDVGNPADRNAFEQLLRERPLRGAGPRIDQRCTGRHGHGFLEPADRQCGVDRRREGGVQLDAFTPHGLEAGQTERHRVRTRPKIDDAVRAILRGDGALLTLDQRRARDFDRDAWHRGARAVTHHTDNRRRRLRLCNAGRDDDEQRGDHC